MVKIIFKQMPLELESEMIFDFLNTDWSIMITDKYPEFLKVRNIKSKKERETIIKDLVIQIRKRDGEKMDVGLITIKSNWQKVERRTLQTLSEIIQEDWPEREIVGYISINPICPRYLDSWSFSVSPETKSPNITIAHEISHFLYFRKFKKLFPQIGKGKYESPHKEWLLSELVATTILNDPRMIMIIGPGAGRG